MSTVAVTGWVDHAKGDLPHQHFLKDSYCFSRFIAHVNSMQRCSTALRRRYCNSNASSSLFVREHGGMVLYKPLAHLYRSPQ